MRRADGFSSRIQNFPRKPPWQRQLLCHGGSRLGHVTGCSCVSQPSEGTGCGKVPFPGGAARPCQEPGGCSRYLPAQLRGRVLSCFVSLIYTSVVTRFSYLYIDSAEQVLQQPVKKLCASPQARRHFRGVLRERWPKAEATKRALLPPAAVFSSSAQGGALPGQESELVCVSGTALRAFYRSRGGRSLPKPGMPTNPFVNTAVPRLPSDRPCCVRRARALIPAPAVGEA